MTKIETLGQATTESDAPIYRTDEDGTVWRVWTDAERAQHRAENENTERWLDQHRAHRMPGDFEARQAVNLERAIRMARH